MGKSWRKKKILQWQILPEMWGCPIHFHWGNPHVHVVWPMAHDSSPLLVLSWHHCGWHLLYHILGHQHPCLQLTCSGNAPQSSNIFGTPRLHVNRMSSGPRDRGPNLKESKPEPREKCPNFKSMEETKPGPREKGPNFKAWRDRHQTLDQDKRAQKFFIYFFFPLPMAVHVHVGSPSSNAAIDWRNSAEAYLKVGACQQGEHIWGSPRVCFLLVKPERNQRRCFHGEAPD